MMMTASRARMKAQDAVLQRVVDLAAELKDSQPQVSVEVIAIGERLGKQWNEALPAPTAKQPA